MINLSRVVMSPNLKQPFVIYRKLGSWVNGRWQQVESSINAEGVVSNTSPQEINQLPEGDRVSGVMTFHTQTELFRTSTENKGTSDELEWSGKRYRVAAVVPYGCYGYYKAFAVYMEGD